MSTDVLEIWKYVPIPHSRLLLLFLTNIQGNRNTMRRMVLEQPSATLEDHWMGIVVVGSHRFRGIPLVTRLPMPI